MAKPKKVKAERLEDILFACRNHLRGKADQSDKRDVLLTLVFLKFMSDRFEDHAASVLDQQEEKLKNALPQGLFVGCDFEASVLKKTEDGHAV